MNIALLEYRRPVFCQNETEVRQKASEMIRQYKQPMLVEEYIDGDEAQVTVLEKNGRPWVLPPAVFRYQKKMDFGRLILMMQKWSEGWEAEMSDWVLDKNCRLDCAPDL